jgi:hypothetical protein
MVLRTEVITMTKSLKKDFCDVARKAPPGAVSLCPASMNDARVLYDWRRDSGAAPGSYREHLAWLRGILSDPRQLGLIGRVGSRPVGMLAMQDETDGSFVISAALTSRDGSGRNYGTEMLAAVSEKMRGLPFSAAVWARQFRGEPSGPVQQAV